ncbi:MFS transporter [Paenibacillus endoradicis]|uniref:MFS transporter n=1 Tax=Paenibacillus endoradicis TaxID=2972487 RepID=UPI0021596D46|nr:MFS transporter [Paenibacillus endoradicis]MCR8656611.1 MFS transporter [Paenibacillus endoradicis]
MTLQKHWKISLLAIMAIGPGLMVNSALIPIQNIIQKALGTNNTTTFVPLIISTITFALFIPLGPPLRQRIGVRNTYLIAMLLFIIGALLSALTFDMLWMTLGRFLQGMGSGVMLMIMLPLLVLSFPIEKRNLALFVLLLGFFGSAIVGMYLGNVALIYNQWRWIFYIASAIALAGIILSQFFLRNELHNVSKGADLDRLGISLIMICSVIALITLNYLANRFGSQLDIWIIIIGLIVIFFLFIIAENKTKNPVIAFKLIMHPKPLLGMLMAITSNITMALSLLAIQGILRNIYGIPNKQLLLLYGCLLIGVIIAAGFSTTMYDKIGPGLLGFIGSLAIVAVNIQWFFLEKSYSLPLIAVNLTILIAGVGITVGSGLMGAALGGALPDLVKRMTAVQFIRFLIYTAATVIIGWYSKNDYETTFNEELKLNPLTEVQSAQAVALTLTYHDLFLASLIVGGLLCCFSLGLHLTGKGHKLAHKPHLNHEPAKN